MSLDAKNKLENALIGLDGVSNIKSLEGLINVTDQDFVDTQSLPLRAYLDTSLVPALVEGLRLVSQERY
jgi:Dpy-30 motif